MDMMKRWNRIYSIKLVFIALLTLYGCSSTDIIETPAPTASELPTPEPTAPTPTPSSGGNDNNDFKYLALGDSYTIGESVCESCRFPIQLVNRYNEDSEDILSTKIIAHTGWRTDNLIDAIDRENPDADYDLVTLLIGVNNQYQSRSFTQYEEEFPKLLNTAIQLAGGDASNVIVVSIPDYAYTPYGQGSSNPERISREIDNYNDFAKSNTEARNIIFLNITDITRRGLQEPDLVASDGLHPSTIAYKEFVDRLLPIIQSKLSD